MREITYRQAVNEALAEEMERDPNVFLMGEEVAEYNGAYKISQGLLENFGPKRVIDTPIAEAGFAGLGVGAAMAGLRPIIEFMTFSFSLVAFDQIVNNAPNMLTMSGGQFHVPDGVPRPERPRPPTRRDPFARHRMLVRQRARPEGRHARHAARRQGPAQDRHPRRQPRARAGKRMLYSTKGEVEDLGTDVLVPFGKAAIPAPGTDVTILCYAQTVRMALAAAETLAGQGINAEVLDLRSIKPLDLEPSSNPSPRRTASWSRSRTGPSAGSARSFASRFRSTFSTNSMPPILRVTQEEVPMPYNEALEAAVLPSAEKIVNAVREICPA